MAKEKVEKLGAARRGPVSGGYVLNGGVKAIPHNLTLDIRRNKLIYILLLFRHLQLRPHGGPADGLPGFLPRQRAFWQ